MNSVFFETIKVLDGVFFNLPLHAERMKRTLAAFYPGLDIPDISTLHLPHECSQGLFKCKITYSDRIESIAYTPYERKHIQTLGIIECSEVTYPWKTCDRKALDRLLSLSGFDEVIITCNGFLSDTSFSNIVLENKNGLFTPSSFLLNGTKRQDLLQKNVIQEKDIHKEDLYNYDRLILINAMLDISDGHCFAIHHQFGACPLFVAERVGTKPLTNTGKGYT